VKPSGSSDWRLVTRAELDCCGSRAETRLWYALQALRWAVRRTTTLLQFSPVSPVAGGRNYIADVATERLDRSLPTCCRGMCAAWFSARLLHVCRLSDAGRMREDIAVNHGDWTGVFMVVF